MDTKNNIDLTDEVVSSEDLEYEIYGMSLQDHILRGVAIYDSMGAIFENPDIENGQILDTWLYWANNIKVQVEDLDEEEKEQERKSLIRSIALIVSLAREMPEDVFMS